MSISVIRSYFKDRITDEISTAVEHKDAINVENMHINARDKMFHIIYQNTDNITTDGEHIADTISVTITMLFKGYRNVQSTFDNTYNSIHNIKRRACKISNFTNGIKRVVCDSIELVESDISNDNILEATLSFTCRMDFTTL